MKLQPAKIVKIIEYIRNKSLRWRIMASIGFAILLIAAGLSISMRLAYYSMYNIGDSYKSNSELIQFTQALASTEKALENYVNYRTFESIDAYYNSRNKAEVFF